MSATFVWFSCEFVERIDVYHSAKVGIAGNRYDSVLKTSDGESAKFDLNLGSEPVTVTMEVDHDKRICSVSTNLGSSAEISFPQDMTQIM